MTGTFAQDAIQRVCTRLDAIQDHFYTQRTTQSGRDTPSAFTATTSLARDDDEYQSVQQTIAQLDGILAKDVLHEKALPNEKQLQDALQSIKTFRFQTSALLSSAPSQDAAQTSSTASAAQDEMALAEIMAVARLTYAVYGVLLENLLEQAERVNDQAWYWTEVEDNLVQTATYLVQTLPARVVNLVTAVGKRIAETAQSAHGTDSPSPLSTRELHLSFNRATMKQGIQMIRESPALAIGAMFPQAVRYDGEASKKDFAAASTRKSSRALIVSGARALSPIGLTRHEAKMKRAKLMTTRDEMAERLGTVAQSLSQAEHGATDVDIKQLQDELWSRALEMQATLTGEDTASKSEISSTSDLGTFLENIIRTSLQKQRSSVNLLLAPAPLGNGLPTRLARLWPTLVLGPIAAAVALRIVTQSWDTIVAKAQDAKETVKGFVINWVYEPCLKLLDTIRTGDQDGVIMTRESLNSDLQSLERMVADFSAEKYGLKGPELEEVAKRVREGDLTNVLRIYETELKSPLRSAVSGSLIRSLLIQVQKVKVDIAVAMRGVDQLLKSQQLLFGAIGIAPAMGILYVVGGFVRSRTRIALGSQGRVAGQSTRFRAWEAMRRVDRLLADPDLAVATTLPPKTQGLLLLDLSLLRRLAPQLVAQVAGGASGGRRGAKAKRLRGEFLRDVRDLETGMTQQRHSGSESAEQSKSRSSDAAFPGLGWHARRAAVDRMWKSWGGVLSLVDK